MVCCGRWERIRHEREEREKRESVSVDRLGDSPYKNIEQEPERGEFYYYELEQELYLRRCESLVAL
jgi:hypothetical protein